jgi:hypothetical protein
MFPPFATRGFAVSFRSVYPYRVVNLRILPVGGAAARNLSPRVGHLHITVDDLPWPWADYGNSNTIILVGTRMFCQEPFAARSETNPQRFTRPKKASTKIPARITL